MNRSLYGGIVGGVIAGVAMAFWQWRRRASAAAAPERGEVIYSNTPTASGW